MFKEFRSLRFILWSLAFTVAFAYFWTRGPARAFDQDGNLDLEVVYNGLQAFQEGRNPYRQEEVIQIARENGRRQGWGDFSNVRLLYAPGFLSIFGPLAWIEYSTVEVIWLVLELATWLALLAVAASLADLREGSRKALLLGGLCFAPVHTNLAHGQPGIMFCLLTLVFFWSLSKQRTWVGAIAFAVLLAKPSFAVPAACVGLIRGGWRAILIGGLLGVLTWIPYLQRYGLEDGVAHYTAAIQAVQAAGADADDSRANPHRFDMVNLRSWLSSWGSPESARDGLYWLVMLVAGLVLYRARNLRDSGGLYWTVAAVFSTLAFYHRFYDAAVIFVGVAATLACWNKDRRVALTMAACLLPFAAPGTAFLVHQLGTTYPAWVEAMLIRHQTLALLGLGTAASVGLLRGSATGPSAADTEPQASSG